MCCDLTVASACSRFGIPGAHVGLADAATTQRVTPSIGMMRARYLALTGTTIDAATAESWGLITRSVPQDASEETVTQAIKDLPRASPTAQRAYKQLAVHVNGRRNLARHPDRGGDFSGRHGRPEGLPRKARDAVAKLPMTCRQKASRETYAPEPA
jgi:enoyl-CoA hydratase/carnithine racemase